MRTAENKPIVAVTMGEGNTPLVSSISLPSSSNLFFKLENVNPSGSYKDRFIAAEMAHVLDRKTGVCLATSSGNTGSALAAYCARFGLRCIILVNQNIPSGKLVQMRAHGAIVVRVPEFTTSAEVTQRVFSQLSEFTAHNRAALVVSAFRYCPVGMQGVQSIAHEIATQMPDVEHVFVPVGGGGLYSAMCRGFRDTSATPKIHAVQPEGCPTILNAIRSGSEAALPVESSTSISGLSVPFDIDATLALQFIREGIGSAIGVTDAEVMEAQRILLREEGIYCEPAGAAAFAGYRAAIRNGTVRNDARCICLVTGSGAKDPSSIERVANETESPTISADGILAALETMASVTLS